VKVPSQLSTYSSDYCHPPRSLVAVLPDQREQQLYQNVPMPSAITPTFDGTVVHNVKEAVRKRT